MKKTLTVSELAKRWGVSRSTAYRIVHRRSFPDPEWNYALEPFRWDIDKIEAWEKKAKRGGER